MFVPTFDLPKQLRADIKFTIFDLPRHLPALPTGRQAVGRATGDNETYLSTEQRFEKWSIYNNNRKFYLSAGGGTRILQIQYPNCPV